MFQSIKTFLKKQILEGVHLSVTLLFENSTILLSCYLDIVLSCMPCPSQAPLILLLLLNSSALFIQCQFTTTAGLSHFILLCLTIQITVFNIIKIFINIFNIFLVVATRLLWSPVVCMHQR